MTIRFRLYQLLNSSYPELLKDAPWLEKFYNRVGELVGPKNYTTNKTKWGEMPDWFLPIPAVPAAGGESNGA